MRVILVIFNLFVRIYRLRFAIVLHDVGNIKPVNFFGAIGFFPANVDTTLSKL